MAVEAAELFVTVTADVDKATRNLGRVNDSAQKSEGFLKGAAKSAVGFASGLALFGGGAAAFGLIKGGAIDMNAELERSTLQFETLMGDSDKARAHVESLFDFAAKTPFETGPIIEASRIMETFGGSALNTKENLALFGDAAAATSQPINEVGFWMSRAYADIQAGRPFGEAAMRLAEMGVVTPQVRSKLEDLQKEGAKGDEVWSTLTGALGRFDGAMEKQAQTFDGMVSTFMDGVNMFLAKALRPLFDGLKVLLQAGIELMSSPAFNGAMEAVGLALSSAFGMLADVLGRIWAVAQPIIGVFTGLFSSLQGGADATETVVGGLESLVTSLGSAGAAVQDFIFGAIEQVLAQAPAFADAFFQFASTALDAFVRIAPLLLDQLLGLIGRATEWVLNTGVPMMANALAVFAQKFIEWIPGAAEQLGALLPVIGEKIINFIAQYAPVIIGKLVEWGIAFIGWVAKEVLPRLPGILATVGGAILGWLARTTPVVIARVADMGAKFIAMVGQKLGQVPGIVATWLGQVVSRVATWAGTMVSRAAMAAADFVAKLVQHISQAPGKIMNFLGQIPGMIAGWAGKIATGALNAGRGFVKNFINALIGLPGQVANAVRSAFAKININVGPFHITGSGISVDLPKIELPSFAVGAWNLPTDMIAQVHKGEMIIPEDIAERLRGGRGFGGGETVVRGGGGQVINVIIQGDYYGIDRNIDDLSERLARSVRAGRPKRTLAPVTSG